MYYLNEKLCYCIKYIRLLRGGMKNMRKECSTNGIKVDQLDVYCERSYDRYNKIISDIRNNFCDNKSM